MSATDVPPPAVASATFVGGEELIREILQGESRALGSDPRIAELLRLADDPIQLHQYLTAGGSGGASGVSAIGAARQRVTSILMSPPAVLDGKHQMTRQRHEYVAAEPASEYTLKPVPFIAGSGVFRFAIESASAESGTDSLRQPRSGIVLMLLSRLLGGLAAEVVSLFGHR